MSTSINPNRVNFFSFPDYENPRLKDDMVNYFFICLVFQLPLKHRLIIIALLVVCSLFHHFLLVAFFNFIISFLLRFWISSFLSCCVFGFHHLLLVPFLNFIISFLFRFWISSFHSCSVFDIMHFCYHHYSLLSYYHSLENHARKSMTCVCEYRMIKPSYEVRKL